jgi:acyl-CoA thioester hydrolase
MEETEMPRLRLEPLDGYPFGTDITVRITDLNYGGHVGNDTFLSLIHEARVAFLASLGLSELDCGGISLIMADAAVVFLAEAYAGDTLRFEVAAGEASRCGFRLFHRVTRPADGKTVLLAETGMAGWDYRAGKIMPLPAAVREKLGFA